VLPIGVILVVVLLPVIAGAVAFRVERRLAKVERASEALAVGDFSARVDDKHGAPDELAARFNAMAERVEQLVRSRDELVQAVSHELGSPLSRLRFHMELLAHQPDEQRAQRLDAMTHELDALDELVAELLSYVQSDDLHLDRQTFDPTRGINDLVELARLDAPEEQAVEVELSLSSDAIVFADQRLFQRAIENLLRNAVRHARGKVLLELTQDEEQVRVAVHDDGPGIPEEQRDKVLAPFVRLGVDRDRKTGGVGLGLAIVNRIVRRHDGRLAIATSPTLGGTLVATSWPKRS
jgi:two-component system sensor histidine kinase RstB